MRSQLIEILREPGTHSPLELEAQKGTGDRIEEGRLVSKATGRSYPIVRGIPRFVEHDAYADSFGLQWNRFREVQVDSANGQSHSVARFDAEAGWRQTDLENRWVLDAGCGAGRFAEVAASRGPNLVAMDYSSAVEASARTLARFPNADVVQGDLLQPPFAPGTFDYAYCIGVVQHTPNPKRAVENVVGMVRTGGSFSFTIYARRPWSRFHGKYLIRPLTKRLPRESLLRAIQASMPFLFPVTDRAYRIPYLGRLFRFVMPVATYVDRDEWTREQRYREAVLDTFDMLSPSYDQPMSWQEMEGALQGTGAHRWEFRTRVPINVVGER